MREEAIKSNTPQTPLHVSGPRYKAAGEYSTLHYHDEMELLLIYEGSFITVVDDVEYTVNSGDIIFINSGVPHRTYSKGPVNTGMIQFRENDFLNTDTTKLVKYSVKLNNLTDSKVRIIKNKELFDTINKLLSEYANHEPAYEIYIRGCVYHVLAILYRSKILVDTEEFLKAKETQKILPAIEYINKNYNGNITLESASEMLGFDPSYFCRLFKNATGATFTEYLNFVRVCKAEKMLSSSQLSILEISEAVGFSSVSYFNRIFKKHRNCSPRNYRMTEHRNM